MVLFNYFVNRLNSQFCYAYDIRNKNATETKNSFQWNWLDKKVKYFTGSQQNPKQFKDSVYDETKTWEVIGPMGPNVLFNEDGIVFSTPFARSFRNPCERKGKDRENCKISFGSESGTIILRKSDGDFIIGNGKWRKDRKDNLQSLAGTSFAKGKFYGDNNDQDSRRY